MDFSKYHFYNYLINITQIILKFYFSGCCVYSYTLSDLDHFKIKSRDFPVVQRSSKVFNSHYVAKTKEESTSTHAQQSRKATSAIVRSICVYQMMRCWNGKIKHTTEWNERRIKKMKKIKMRIREKSRKSEKRNEEEKQIYKDLRIIERYWQWEECKKIEKNSVKLCEPDKRI